MFNLLQFSPSWKQGGSQSANDNAKGRLARSAGAQLRRDTMNKKLVEDVKSILKSWRPYTSKKINLHIRATIWHSLSSSGTRR